MASGVTQSGTISASGVAVTAGTVSGVKTQLSYFGYSFRATAAAVVRVRQGTISGPILDVIAIPTIGDGDHEWYGPQGRLVKDDIFVEVVSGTVEGVIFYG